MCAYIAEKQEVVKSNERWVRSRLAKDYICTFRNNCIEKRRIINFALAFFPDT